MLGSKIYFKMTYIFIYVYIYDFLLMCFYIYFMISFCQIIKAFLLIQIYLKEAIHIAAVIPHKIPQ